MKLVELACKGKPHTHTIDRHIVLGRPAHEEAVCFASTSIALAIRARRGKAR